MGTSSNQDTRAVLHQSKVVERRGMTLTTTLCGRMNSGSKDGMNIASADELVTCKFCLRALLKPVQA